MNKLFAGLFLILIAAHLFRPFGLPGLRRRGDFWKIAMAGLVVFGLVAIIRPE